MDIVTFVNSTIVKSITISVNFNDGTKDEKTYVVGDEISIDYIKDKALVSIYGKLKGISSIGMPILLVIDASTEFESNIVNVNVDNIRKLNDIIPAV